ncbi:MAG: serine protease [Methylococcaceae bacterium]
MKQLLHVKFLLFLWLSLPLSCEAIQSRIIGGKNAVNRAYPFIVSIEYALDGEQFCSGSLISPTKILTAAHCLKENQAVQIRLGTNNKNKQVGQIIYVAGQVRHPKFNELTLDYDVAVFTLMTPAKLSDNTNVIFFPQPCSSLNCVTGLAKSNTLVRVIGWGATSPDGNKNSASADLKEVDVPIISNTTCKNVMKYDGDVTSRMICAGFVGGGKDSCIGDSGSPLFSYLASAKTGVQTGIASWGGSPCAAKNTYGVYTRISNPEINDFIRQEMQRTLEN